MKFEMTGFEFSTFCTQLANGSVFTRIQELEQHLTETRTERDQALDDHSASVFRISRLERTVDAANRDRDTYYSEVRELRAKVKDLQDKLTPNRIECAYSRAFNYYLSGQKIYAIKEIRALLNIGLKEAKDVVEGSFTDLNGPATSMFTLSLIFADLGKEGEGFARSRRDRLASLVSRVFSNDELDSILSGKFHNSFPVGTVLDAG